MGARAAATAQTRRSRVRPGRAGPRRQAASWSACWRRRERLARSRVGPVAHQAEAIDGALRDSRAIGILAVITPEQMPISEALRLRELLADQFGLGLEGAVVNRMFPARFSAREAAELESAPDGPAVRSARWFHARARAQRAQLGRLRRGLAGVRRTTLPFLFAGEPDRAAIEHLARPLDRLLQ